MPRIGIIVFGERVHANELSFAEFFQSDGREMIGKVGLAAFAKEFRTFKRILSVASASLNRLERFWLKRRHTTDYSAAGTMALDVSPGFRLARL